MQVKYNLQKPMYGKGPAYLRNIKCGQQVRCVDGSYVMELKDGVANHYSLACPLYDGKHDLIVIATDCRLPTDYGFEYELKPETLEKVKFFHESVNDTIVFCTKTNRTFFVNSKHLITLYKSCSK